MPERKTRHCDAHVRADLAFVELLQEMRGDHLTPSSRALKLLRSMSRQQCAQHRHKKPIRSVCKRKVSRRRA